MKRLLAVCVVLSFVAPIHGEKRDQKKATIAYLQKLQNKDGGFRPNTQDETSSLRATSAALRALKYNDGTVLHRASAVDFVKKCFDKKNGGFADSPGGKPEVLSTAIGLMALVELNMPRDDYETAAVKYLDENVKTFEDVRIAIAGLEAVGKQPADVTKWKKLVEQRTVPPKGQGFARDAGGAAVALMRMGQKPADPKALLKQLDEGQAPDGGYARGNGPSDLESTYRVLRCYHMLKARPADVGRLRAFITACRNADGGYGVSPRKASSAGATYFAAIVLHWLSEKPS